MFLKEVNMSNELQEVAQRLVQLWDEDPDAVIDFETYLGINYAKGFLNKHCTLSQSGIEILKSAEVKLSNLREE
jgi:hypothetical protein